MYALPGFIDSHMHLESSMLLPAMFARAALPCGTTAVSADPHEICNVLGKAGVAALMEAAKGLPLRIVMMAPSTVPSAPGFEDSGCAVGAAEAAEMLELPGVAGLGEVMDFGGVAAGEERILSVVEEGVKRGAIVDGHASVLTGRALQAFRAAGIDSDHTLTSPEKLAEELSLGFTVQIQECALSEDMARAMNEAPAQERICLVTDDVPLPRLMREGHLNHVVERAVSLGLEPLRAVRFAALNPAARLRLYDSGAIAPGMRADIQLVKDIKRPAPEYLLCGGVPVWEDGRFLVEMPCPPAPEVLCNTVRMKAPGRADLALALPVPKGFRGGTARANVILQDGVTVRTKRGEAAVRLSPERDGLAAAETEPLLKMAVFDRYGGGHRGLALVGGMDGVTGAAALTYGHDCHNLAVYGGNDADMALAADALTRAGGGLCTAAGGRVTSLVPLPYGGILCGDTPDELLPKLENFLSECRAMGFRHQNLLMFFTVMPLAVSPEIKCTDRGLLDVVERRFIPPIENAKEDG